MRLVDAVSQVHPSSTLIPPITTSAPLAAPQLRGGRLGWNFQVSLEPMFFERYRIYVNNFTHSACIIWIMWMITNVSSNVPLCAIGRPPFYVLQTEKNEMNINRVFGVSGSTFFTPQRLRHNHRRWADGSGVEKFTLRHFVVWCWNFSGWESSMVLLSDWLKWFGNCFKVDAGQLNFLGSL